MRHRLTVMNETPVNADHPSRAANVIEVDARGLEPPLPLVRILEATADLPPGVTVRARTDRRPMHLYAHLEARGLIAETFPESDGSFLTHIRRA
jgi:hypothetical protein